MKRQTPQRKKILEVIESSDIPMTAEQVYESSIKDFPKLALTTVYRSLEAFVEAGVLSRSIRDDGVAHYQLSVHHRHYLTCVECKKSVPLPGCPFEQLEEELVKETGFSISEHRMEFFGKCPNCQKKHCEE